MKKKLDTLYFINTKTGEEKEYKHRDLRINKELKKDLRMEALENNEWKFFCGCNIEHPIEMKISKGQRIMVYTAKNEMVKKHSPYCAKGGNHSEYNPGFKENDKDGYDIKTKFKLTPPSKKDFKKELIVEEFQGTSKQRLSDISVINGKLTFSAVIKNLNIQTWNSHAKYKNKILDIYDFNRKIYGMSSKMHLFSTKDDTNSIKMQDIFFNSTKQYNIKNKDVKLVYMLLDKYSEGEQYYKIYGKEKNKYGQIKTVLFNAPKELVEQSIKESRINLEWIENQNIIISGLIYRNKSGFLEFYELTFMLANNYGLYSESRYEAQYYDLLYDCDIYFYKPRWYIEGYGEHIADGESVDSYNNKIVLIEVFGYKTEEYLKERESKIKFIQSELGDTHVLLQWNPCFGEPLPSKECIEEFFKNIE